MKKRLTSLTRSLWIIATLTLSCLAIADDTEVRQILTGTYPSIKAGEIRNSDIPGLYEVEVGPNVIYFYPHKKLMVFGEIWTKEGKSLTAARRDQLAVKRVKDIPLDKAIRIGNGKNRVIEFTDPDCPFCRKASEYLKARSDTTRYIYFFPLPAHKDAENKARFILCSNDKTKAYEEVMSGRHDDGKLDPCSDAKVSALLKEHRDLAARAGVTGTPSFWINGQFVMGANIPAIESILKNQRNVN